MVAAGPGPPPATGTAAGPPADQSSAAQHLQVTPKRKLKTKTCTHSFQASALIHLWVRTELEVASLEREESMISTDESFILNRLKVVERSPEDIIKVQTC